MQTARKETSIKTDATLRRIGLVSLTAMIVGSNLIPMAVNAQAATKGLVMMDVTGRHTPDTIIESISEKAKKCWVPSDPAFAGFVVAGKRLDEDGKTVRLDFKPASTSKPQKAGRKADGGNVDGRILRIHAVPTFSGGYAIFAEQSEGIDIIPSLKRNLFDVERSGVIAC